jgi:signal transduction histidine kinase
MSSVNLLTIDIRYEQDVVLTRQRARQVAALLDLGGLEQTAFATAASELARNAFRYAGHGTVTFAVRTDDRRQLLTAQVQDHGPGIANLDAVLDGRYQSQTGMGLGLVGAKRLNDEFDVRSTPGTGTTVRIGKVLPTKLPAVVGPVLSRIAGKLAERPPQDPLAEVQQQNKELLQALDDLRSRQAEVERLNVELAETNRGVVALYAELDEKADSLRRASEYKSRFLNDMTHELRTPLNAIVSLARLLLDRTDGELTSEQERQVSLIHRSSTSLGDMVNDLLDLAKIEAGRTDLYVGPFDVRDVLAGLRGMFRPAVADGRVPLQVDDPVDGPTEMVTDERKVTQILRNLVSNALKFTERGNIGVATAFGPDDTVVFTVADTGIGIAPEHLETIFHDYTQVESAVQRRVTGTGLGLPLTRKLCRLLGGDVAVCSTPGVGSTFAVTLPVHCPQQPPLAGNADADLGVGSVAGA